MSYDSLTDEVMRKQAKVCAELRAEVERLRAKADAGNAFLIGARIVELSKPAAKESEQQHGQESTATAAPSRSPQGEGVEVPSRGQEQGASLPRGIGQPAHPPGARGGESGIVAESQGHRSGEAVSYRSFSVYGVTFTADPMAPRSAVQRAMEFITHAFSAVTTMVETKPEEPAAEESEPAKDVPKCGKLVAYINGEPMLCDAAKGHAWACSASILEPRPIEKPEEPDWTVTLAAQAKVAYVNSAAPADELKVRLLSLVVEGLCNLGREVRRGGAK